LKVLLILGSNVGNRRENLKRTEKLIEKFVGKILKRSLIIETAPFGVTNQPKFLNCGLLVDALHPPFELLRLVKWIEKRVGRYKTYRWGPRVADVDIITIEHITIDTPLLKVPHPGLRNREFFKRIFSELYGKNRFSSF